MEGRQLVKHLHGRTPHDEVAVLIAKRQLRLEAVELFVVKVGHVSVFRALGCVFSDVALIPDQPLISRSNIEPARLRVWR